MEEEQTVDASGFDAIAKARELDEQGSLFDDIVAQEDNKTYAPSSPALASTTLLTALARANPSQDIEMQLGEDSIASARQLLEMGREKQLRNEIAVNRTQRQMANLSSLTKSVGFNTDPALVRGAEIAYQNVLRQNYEDRARTAIEEEAVERIQEMAARNPVQAKVLLDNLEKGDANKSIRDFNTRMFILHQRAEELDAEYQQSGWGRAILNFALNLIPTNFNFARSGVVGEGTLGSFFKIGEGIRDQSEQLYNMPLEEFAKYAAKDGPLMESIRSNATTAFDLTADPAAAVHIMEGLMGQTDNERQWNNVWGGVEVASLTPFKTVVGATRTLMSAGAADAAVRNLDNAIRVMDEAGPEAMYKVTGVTEGELAEEISVSAVKPRPNGDVPLSEQVATRREAALKALDEMFNPPEGERFRTPEELKAAFDYRAGEITNIIGKPVKDFKLIRESLPGGQHINMVEYIFGKKNGHGYASEASARNAARRSGIQGETVEVVETTQRIVDPKEGFDLPVYHGTTRVVDGPLRESTDGAMGPGVYVGLTPEVSNTYARTGGEATPNVLPLLARRNKIFGIDNVGGYTVDEAYRVLDEAGIDRADFDLWKSGQNIERLEYEVGESGLIDSQQVFNDVTRYLERRARQADETGDFQTGELLLQDRLREKGWEGHAARIYEHDQAVIYQAGNLVNKLEPAQVFRDASGQWFVKGRKAMPETGFFSDPLQPENASFLSRMFGRYVRAAPRITDPNLHGRAIEGGEYLTRARKVIQGNIMSKFAELPKTSRELISQIGIKQSQTGRWFTRDEFNYLTERQLGRRATEKEIETFEFLRLVNNMDWELRNTEVYLRNVMQGKESVTFNAPWGQTFDMDVKINYKPDVIPSERVFDASTNIHYTRQTNPLTSAKLDELRNNGYVMMEIPEGLKDPQGIMVNRVLIKKSDLTVSELRREQLNYAEGGHRMYADEVFIKQGREGVQSDTGSKYLLAPHTFRTAKNIAEGKRWADVMNRARLAVKENPGVSEVHLDDVIFQNDKAFPTGREFLDAVDDEIIDLKNPFEAVWDRELPSMYAKSGEDVTRLFNEDELGITGYFRTTGRMYTSPKGEILEDTTGKVADILDPYDTLTQSLEQVTRNLGLFNYKTEALERFANTYREYLDIQPNMRSPARILQDAKVRPDIPAPLKNQIDAQRDAILNVLRYETPNDRLARQRWQDVAEWVIGDGTGFGRKFAHDSVLWFRDSNPIAKMRGLAFDMKLGMWNPGQLLIQISTMASATALSPKYGFKGMAGLFPMHGYLLSRGSEAYLDRLVKTNVHKVMGFDDVNEFKEYSRHLFNHGFADMNGSHVMINDYGPAAHFGAFTSKLGQARESGRVFFYTAETWNRLVAYRIAWGEAKDAGKRGNDLDFTSTIMRLADDYSMNMTGESAAYWQKGLLSIPTQFWAYNVRMMDAMVGKRFTPQQRIRLAITHFGLMGTAGIPVLPAVTEYMKQKHGSAPPIDTLQGMLDRGLIDYINYELTNNDILLGERVGTGGWASEVVKTMFGTSEYGEKSFVDLVGGATYSIAKSTGKTMWEISKYAAAESGADMGDAGLTKDGFINLLKEISTFGNASKAMVLHQTGMYKSNKGTVLVDDLPPSNSWYTALSFRPAKAQEISYLMAWREDNRESVKEIASKLRNWRQEAISNPDKMDENMKKANVMIRLLPPADRIKVLKQTNAITDESFYDHLEKKVREEQAAQQGIEE